MAFADSQAIVMAPLLSQGNTNIEQTRKNMSAVLNWASPLHSVAAAAKHSDKRALYTL